MRKIELIFNLPTTLLAMLLARILTDTYQISSLPLTQKQVDSYQKDGILMMDWQIFPSEKLEEISKTLLTKVKR